LNFVVDYVGVQSTDREGPYTLCDGIVSINGKEYTWEAMKEYGSWNLLAVDFPGVLWSTPAKRMVEAEIMSYLEGS